MGNICHIMLSCRHCCPRHQSSCRNLRCCLDQGCSCDGRGGLEDLEGEGRDRMVCFGFVCLCLLVSVGHGNVFCIVPVPFLYFVFR